MLDKKIGVRYFIYHIKYQSMALAFSIVVIIGVSTLHLRWILGMYYSWGDITISLACEMMVACSRNVRYMNSAITRFCTDVHVHMHTIYPHVFPVEFLSNAAICLWSSMGVFYSCIFPRFSHKLYFRISLDAVKHGLVPLISEPCLDFCSLFSVLVFSMHVPLLFLNTSWFSPYSHI